MDAMPRGRQGGRVARSERGDGQTSRREERRSEGRREQQQWKWKKKKERQERRKEIEEEEREEGKEIRTSGFQRSGGSCSSRGEIQGPDEIRRSVRRHRAGSFDRREARREEKGSSIVEKQEKEGGRKQREQQLDELRLLERRDFVPGNQEGSKRGEEGPRSPCLTSHRGDAGAVDHSKWSNVVSPNHRGSASSCSTLLSHSDETKDDRRYSPRSPHLSLFDRFGIAGPSGGSSGRGAAEAEEFGINVLWDGFPHQPKDGACSTRAGVGGQQHRKEGSFARSKGGDEVKESERKRRRLVARRHLEGQLGRSKWKRKEGKERRKGLRRQTEGRLEGRRPREERRKEEEGVKDETPGGAPEWELESLDGCSWTPSLGDSLGEDYENDDDMVHYDDGEKEKRDANNESKDPRVTGKDWCGKAQVYCPTTEGSIRNPSNSTTEPTTEGFGQVEAEDLPVEGRAAFDVSCSNAPHCLGVSCETPMSKRDGSAGVKGLSLGDSGEIINGLWTTCSKLELKHCKAQPIGKGIFPLPTVHVASLESFIAKTSRRASCFFNLCRALNSLAGWGCEEVSREVCDVQRQALRYLLRQVDRVSEWPEKFDELSWEKFFSVRSVDYKGDEIMNAHYVGWKELEPALPKEIGAVRLEDVVELGTLHYVTNFEEYLLPEEDMIPVRPPRVMIPPEEWEEVAKGLIDRGICGIISEDEIFRVKGQLLLNGLFGVSKSEWIGHTEIHRLIMNLIPVNQICRGMSGDVGTLPSWSGMTPLFLEDEEQLVISSEDVRCFFYIFRVPPGWRRFMAFNKPLPPSLCPKDGGSGRFYLCSHVLPMGFKNSVSIAQHVHRNIIQLAGKRGGHLSDSAAELRKDRSFTFANPAIRVYLDNFDLLAKMDSKTADVVCGKPCIDTLCLRSEYESWGIPNHPKKSVQQQRVAEVQGALVDGVEGIAVPKREKVLKYVQLAMMMLERGRCTLKQAQVVGGGLVYLAMFRRPLLGSLNGIWRFILDLSEVPPVVSLPLPPVVVLELTRFISLVPLCVMDFRMVLAEPVTASDASTTGGGVTVSRCLTEYGKAAALSQVRGDVLGEESHVQILSIGLFDGIGALRIALEALQVSCIGHVSVETSAAASRVVESHFPGALLCGDVTAVGWEEVRRWACTFSQVSLIIIGAGPPCQGVSGLNSERKGALRDERSRLFKEVPSPWLRKRSLGPWYILLWNRSNLWMRLTERLCPRSWASYHGPLKQVVCHWLVGLGYTGSLGRFKQGKE